MRIFFFFMGRIGRLIGGVGGVPLLHHHHACFCYLLGGGVGDEVADGVLDGLDLVGLGLWDLEAELVLEGQHELDSIEGIEAEIVDEVGFLLHGIGVYFVEILHDRDDPIPNFGFGRSTARVEPLAVDEGGGHHRAP